METVRKIVDAQSLLTILDLPDSMKDRKVELVVLPISETKTTRGAPKSMKGALKAYANPALVHEEKGAWERAAVEKHGYI